MNHLDLKNRVAIITGGAQGFGLAISKRIIESGGKVVIWDIDENAVETALKEINSNDLSFKKVVNIIKDLKPVIKMGFTKGLDQPKVKTISSAEIDMAKRQQGLSEFEAEPKQTVFGLNEKKK